MKETININFSKAKLIFILCLVLMILYSGYFLISVAESTVLPLLSFLYGVLGILSGLLGIVVMLKQLLSGKPGLVLCNKGLTCNVRLSTPVFIFWEDIASIDIFSTSGNELITIRLHNCHKSGDKIRNSQLQLFPFTLKINSKVLLDLLISYQERQNPKS